MRSRYLLFGVAAIVIAVLVALSVADQFLVDFLWFKSLGYRSVFVTQFLARIEIAAAMGAVAFAAIFTSAMAALRLSRDRERLRVVPRPERMAEINLPDLIRALGGKVPWKLIITAVSLVLAGFVALGEQSSWDVYLKALYSVPFGRTDPAFGRDIGFYVLTLPLLEQLRDAALLIIFMSAAAATGVFWMRGALDFREAPPQITPQAIALLSVLLGLFFFQRAFSYWLGRFGLLLHTNGVVFGLRYVDHALWQPGLWLLASLSVFAGLLCFLNLRDRGARIPLFAAIIVFGPAIMLNFLQPVIERLWVKPDELRVEKPYLVRNIEMTRQAYKLDGIDVKPFAGRGQLTKASLAQDEATISNIRLWDPRPLIATYRQLQAIRLYYDFRDVDIDRYRIQDRYSAVMLSARELNPALLPGDAQTWVNQHFKFTHGNGIAMSPVSARDAEGMPIFYIRDIPPVSNVGVHVSQPGIYFGEEPDNYVVVKAGSPEFDYPRGADNVFSFYKADAGIPIDGFAARILFSYLYRDVNLLVSENIVAGSKILIYRNIGGRVGRLAPFLIQDRDPYIVLQNGRLYWVVDCYTTSDHYPYSQRNPGDLNYIRNSVKAVIDAYTGATDFYVADPDDALIKAWQRIFPGMFKPLSAMDAGLRAHIRYPEDFFLVQADIYRTYHMTDPQVFYNREDLWGFPRENFGGETVTMQPYYVIMRLPGEPESEYILMLPMVPRGRDNMIAWLAARCDGADYGHLFEYEFSKDRLFYGPYQIQARIHQNPEISRQLSLWNQMGSKALLGNLLVIPLQDSLLYVEPLYIRAENGQLPELDRVIGAYSNRVVMRESLDETLNVLFAPAENAPAVIAASVAPAASGISPPLSGRPALSDTKPKASNSGLAAASGHYQKALDALRSGDWPAFGNEMKKLGEVLNTPASPNPN